MNNPIVLNFRGLNDLEIEDRLRLLAQAQTDNPTAAPGTTITSVELLAAAELIKTKRTKQKTAEAEAEAATAQKLEAAAAAKVLIGDYAADVWPKTGKDVSKCVLLAFDVSGGGGGGGGSPPPPEEQQITGVELDYGPNAGSLTVRANAKPQRAISLEAQINLTPNAAPTWQHADIFSSTPFTLTGLPSGSLVQVRLRAVFAGGVKGPWSDIAEHRVP
jgi:hypothetical protein